MSASKRYLISGGAGFIGSELTRQLAATGAEVIVVDNLVNGKEENVSEVVSERVHLEVTDIRDTAKMQTLMQGVDIVFHLACLGVRHSIHSPTENHDVNASATLELLKLSKELGVGRFVYVSSSEVYGTAIRVPMDEQVPTYPHTVYGASKLAGEHYARAFYQTYKYPTVMVRPFNSFGPRSHHEGDSGEVIPKMILRTLAGKPMIIFGDGEQTRDFTFVADTARGILLAGTSETALGETINLGQGSEIKIKDLALLIRKVLDKPGAVIEHIEPRPGDVLRLYADSTKAHNLLNFTPEVSLEAGLRELLDWYLAEGVDAEKLLENERVRNWVAAEK
ncbi:SDR family NAD(P)-dependent oxidoreductase [Calditrichota bacterium]